MMIKRSEKHSCGFYHYNVMFYSSFETLSLLLLFFVDFGYDLSKNEANYYNKDLRLFRFSFLVEKNNKVPAIFLWRKKKWKINFKASNKKHIHLVCWIITEIMLPTAFVWMDSFFFAGWFIHSLFVLCSVKARYLRF